MAPKRFRKAFSDAVESKIRERTWKTFRTIGTSRNWNGPVLVIDFSSGKTEEVCAWDPAYAFFDAFSGTADTVLAAKVSGEFGLLAAERLARTLSVRK